jgi:hypothetical protein
MTVPTLDEPTHSAHWGWTEHRYFGHRVFGELTGQESLAGLLALSIVGRRLPPDCSALLDDAAAALTLADPRIWPLKLTRVVAAYGHMVPALCAGMLMEDEARIGPWAFLEAAKALLELHATLGTGSATPERVREVVDAYLGKHGFMWGFGTPFRSEDERLVAFRRCVAERQRDQLPYWRTMTLVSQAVRAARKAEPNIGVALAAVLLDMGLTPTQIGALVVSLMQHMFFAHAVEGVTAKTALRELPAAYVTYQGRPARLSPRAQAEAAGEARNISAATTAAE